MVKFIPNNKSMIQTELEIMNSNPQFNLWSTDKSLMDDADVLKEHEESEQLGSMRWIVQYGEDMTGLIDYLPENPKDGFPWIGLFVVHSDFQGTGLASSAYALLEEKLKSYGHTEIRLAILEKNKPGKRFWEKQGFEKYSDGELDGRRIEKWRKELK
ncbi:GNAT family N-acetyltransferase [Pseudalkalibacillus sp. R45]|uniref:GNAT family N-acetyltransferase n=1 Tax=Pseudalkalibacillus sp. R45 TaxID=3457433 RepID=UPI003FCEC853